MGRYAHVGPGKARNEPGEAYRWFQIFLERDGDTNAVVELIATSRATFRWHAMKEGKPLPTPEEERIYREVPMDVEVVTPSEEIIEQAKKDVRSTSYRYSWKARRAAFIAQQAQAVREEMTKYRVETAERQIRVIGSHLSVLDLVSKAFFERLMAKIGRGEDPFAQFTDAEMFQLTMLSARVTPSLLREERDVMGFAEGAQPVDQQRVEKQMTDSLNEDAQTTASARDTLLEALKTIEPTLDVSGVERLHLPPAQTVDASPIDATEKLFDRSEPKSEKPKRRRRVSPGVVEVIDV